METIHRFSHRLFPISETLLQNSKPLRFPPPPLHKTAIFPPKSLDFQGLRQFHRAPSSKFSPAAAPAGGWFSGFGLRKKKEGSLHPEIVKAGDPVLHEPAGVVPIEEIGSERIEKIVEDMIGVMRKAPGVGIAAPQIGIPLRIIVLEDTKEYISYAPKNEIEAQDRRPFDLLVIINPRLEKKGNKTALFFEGCLSVDGFRAVVERHLEVEVTGFDRNGNPIKVDATGWQARILQHECDHLDGTIYVDKFVPRTFRTVENLDLPLPVGCARLGVRQL